MLCHPPRHTALPLTSLLAIALGCTNQVAPTNPSMAAVDESRFALEAAGMRGGPPASLRNIWPNEDGRSWTYRLEQRTWGPLEFRVYPTPDEVPPLPSMDAIEALLENHPIGSDPVTETAGYRMQFLGVKTTESGAVGQNLETEVFDLREASLEAVRSVTARSAGAEGFWRSLARARPDLAGRIAAFRTDAARLTAPAGTASVDEPLFLFGYAWEKTREHIGSYGDLNTRLSWKYLEADLDPGHEFTLQLVPDLADDVFLHVRVLRERTATSALGDHPRAIDVLYVVDYGTSETLDAGSNTTGYSRVFDYGTITYAPKVGPVASYERNLVSTGEPLDPGYRELSVALVSVVPGREQLLP